MQSSNKDNLKVLLIDPYYDDGVSSVPAIPLGLGLIGSYLIEQVPNVEVKILKLMSNILEYIKLEKPDVLGVTNFMWNTNLCIKFSRIAKEVNPDVLIVFGGPDINNKHSDQERFIRLYSHVDLLVEKEGEVAFTKIIETYLKVNRDKVKLREHIGELGNCFYINSEKKFTLSPKLPKIKDMNAMPSPYLTGLFDDFLADKHFQPLLETNRGCPYACTFCQQGDSYYSRVHFKSFENVTTELDYIADNADEDAGLYLIDSNWGMYKEDIPIAHHLKKLNETKNWPKYIDCDTGKSQYDRIRHVAMDVLPGLMSISNSVQTMDQNVLNNVKRLQPKDPVQVIKEFEVGGGEVQQPDFILPLPGENKEGFMKGMKKLLDTKANVRFRVHPTQMLSNTELDSKASIEKYGIQFKYRQHSNFMGYCDGEFICETERVILATKDMSLEDVFYCRTSTVLLDTLLRRAPLRELIEYLNSIDILVSDLARALTDSVSQSPEDIQSCLKEYKDSYLEAMFDTEEEVTRYMEIHQKDYISGDKGGDLLKYSMKLWIDHCPSMMKWLFTTVHSLCNDKDESVHKIIDNLEIFTNLLYYDRINKATEKSVESQFDYDILKWFKEKNNTQIEKFKYPTKYAFKKTNISNINKSEVWNSFGFYRDENSELPTGTNSRYYLSKLRRSVETSIF